MGSNNLLPSQTTTYCPQIYSLEQSVSPVVKYGNFSYFLQGSPDTSVTADENTWDNLGFLSEQSPLADLSVSANPFLCTATLDVASPFDLEQSPISQSTSHQGLNHGPKDPTPTLALKNRRDSREWNSLDQMDQEKRPLHLAPLHSWSPRNCYEPSYEGVLGQHVSSTVPGTSQVLIAPTSSSSWKKSMKSSKPLVWDNSASFQLKRFGSVKEVTSRQTGRRKGRLKPEQAEKAKEMRILRACLLCSLSKAPVSSFLNFERYFTEQISSALQGNCVLGAIKYHH